MTLSLKVIIIKDYSLWRKDDIYTVTQSSVKNYWQIVNDCNDKGRDIPKKITDHKR